MELIIAEKPSVARDIARVLKCTKKGDGFLYNDEYVISWAVGHLVTLYDPEDYSEELKRWRVDTLPIIPETIKLKAIKNTKQQLDILEKIMNRDTITGLICATDSGREGELIFRYIYELLGCKKPFKRLWISSMTDAAIKEGFSKLKDGSEYDMLYSSAKCRSEADWLVGINASRAFTLKYDALLSIGRVQTPTLALIVQRQKEIDSFDTRDYWEIEATFEGWKGTWFDRKNNDTKLFEKEKADEIAAKVKGKTASVETVEKEEKKTPPPLLYDLTELQRDCNKKYGYSAKDTLSIVQDLYEKRKMVTYPRTDSRYLSDDMIPKLKIIAGKLQATEQYNSYASYVIGLDKLPISKRIVDNSKINDHHAIIPTEARANVNALSEREFKVYDLIARRFLQVFYPYYVYSTTKIVTVCENEPFVTRGTTVIVKGWTELNVSGEKEKKEEAPLPDVTEGDVTEVKSVKCNKKKTKPPQAYNDSSLLGAMENAGRFVDNEELKEQLKDSGLGTPATRAAIIERLIQVGYINRKGKSLVPTEKGMKLIAVVPPELKSPETTGRWEKGLSQIAKGKMETDKFMGSIVRYVNYLVDQSKTRSTNVVFAAERGRGGKRRANSLGKCPVCGGDVLENTKSFYCSRWHGGCKFTMWKSDFERYGIHLTGEQITELLKNGKIESLSMTLPQTGEKCTGDIVMRDDKSGKTDIKNVKRIN
jgi:DNA topoisomerase-3